MENGNDSKKEQKGSKSEEQKVKRQQTVRKEKPR